MPFRFFKKNFGLILNSFFIFSMSDDRFGVAKPYMVMKRRKGCSTAHATEKEDTWKQINDDMNRRGKEPTGRGTEEGLKNPERKIDLKRYN